MLQLCLSSFVSFPVKALASFDLVRGTRIETEASGKPYVKCRIGLFVFWAIFASVWEILGAWYELTQDSTHHTGSIMIHSLGYDTMIIQCTC